MKRRIGFVALAVVGMWSLSCGNGHEVEAAEGGAEGEVAGSAFVTRVPAGMHMVVSEIGDDAIAEQRTTGYWPPGADRKDPPPLVLRELGSVPVGDLDRGKSAITRMAAGREIVEWRTGGRVSQAWEQGGETYLLISEGSVASVAREVAPRFEVVSGVLAPPASARWYQGVPVDAATYWSISTPPEGEPPRGSTRELWAAGDGAQVLSFIATEGGRDEATSLAALLGPLTRVVTAENGETAYLSCRDDVCGTGAAAWSDARKTIAIGWSGLADGVIDEILGVGAAGGTK